MGKNFFFFFLIYILTQVALAGDVNGPGWRNNNTLN